MSRSQEHAIAGNAQSEHGGPAVDLRALDPRIQLGRENCEAKTDEDALQYIALHSSRAQISKEEQPNDEKGAYYADEYYKISVGSTHILILHLIVNHLDPATVEFSYDGPRRVVIFYRGL